MRTKAKFGALVPLAFILPLLAPQPSRAQGAGTIRES